MKTYSEFKTTIAEEVELDESSRVETGQLFKHHLDKAIAASEAGNHTQAKRHLANAQTARYGILAKHIPKHQASFDKYKELKHSYTNSDEPIREDLDEAHKINDKVEIIKGSSKGTVGHIGEIRHGAFKGAPKEYTVYHGEHGATRVKKEHIRAIKEGMTNPGLEALASKVRAARTGKPSNPGLEKLAHEKAKAKYLNKESAEQIDELSNKLLNRYSKKAEKEAGKHFMAADRAQDRGNYDKAQSHMDKADKRASGVYKAQSKIKEESLDEISADAAEKYYDANHTEKRANASDLGITKNQARKAHNRIVGSNRALDRMYKREKTYKEEVEVLDEVVNKEHPIYKEYQSLKKQPLKDLKDQISRQHRIIDTSEFRSKEHAVSHILHTKHGERRMKAAFGESLEQLDEISKDTLTSYANKAFQHGNDLHQDLSYMHGNKATDAERKAIRDKISKRNAGVIRASQKMKESIGLEEAKHNLNDLEHATNTADDLSHDAEQASKRANSTPKKHEDHEERHSDAEYAHDEAHEAHKKAHMYYTKIKPKPAYAKHHADKAAHHLEQGKSHNRQAFDEAVDTVKRDEKGKVIAWSHEGDWEKSSTKNGGARGRGKVANLSDVARRKSEKLAKEAVELDKTKRKPIPWAKEHPTDAEQERRHRRDDDDVPHPYVTPPIRREEVELDEASIKLFMGMHQVWHKGKKIASYASKTDAQDHVNSLKEAVENLDELSKDTLKSYIGKAVQSHGSNRVIANMAWDKSEKQDDLLDKVGHKSLKDAKKRAAGISTAVNKLTKEEVEEFMQTEAYDQLDELSKDTLKSYVHKAATDIGFRGMDAGRQAGNPEDKSARTKNFKTMAKRVAGIDKVVNKLTKEDVEPMLTFKELLESISESKIDDLRDKLAIKKAGQSAYDKDYKPAAKSNVQKVKGHSYGAGEEEGDDEDDNNKKLSKPAAPEVKRGRGRPAGSKSGARN